MTGDFEFLRPAWLLALLALPAMALLLRRARRAAEAWREAVDPHLLPHLLDEGSGPARRAGAAVPVLAFVFAVLALAGPSWREVEQPLWQSQLPTVIAADLSSASLATDIAPSRLARLRARINAQLAAHAGGPIGLVAFAGDAFTVTPLTEDVANVALFVEALQPDVMPVDGQAVDRAIAWSRQLMERAGSTRGHIVVLTDHADGAAQRTAANARAAGFTVSAVGLGSAAGAEVPTPSGGRARVALDEASLRALARAGGGRYALLAADGRDAAAFVAPGEGSATDGRERARVRQDGGFWLLPPLMLVLLVAWMRSAAVPLAVVVFAALLLPGQVRATDAWRRADQQAHAQIVRGVDAYRRGRFEEAADHFARADGAFAHYNRGNALAKAGQLDDAVAAYDEALRRAPGMADARANRDAVRAAMRKGAGEGDARNDRRGGASDRGDPNSRRAPKNHGPGQPGTGRGPGAMPPRDPAAQARADAAQRERMRAAQAKKRSDATADAAGRRTLPPPAQTPEQRERRLSNDAALRRVPDEPGSLLREKFRLEYERRQRGGGP